MEIINICLDIFYPEDRNNIIKKYLFPKLLNGDITLEDIDFKLLSDVFNLFEEDDVENLREQIENIIGDFETEEFLETYWKIGKCHNCEKISVVTKCKKEHDEECPYSEITDAEGCNKVFCDYCLFYNDI
jgi:hypothetical protein